MNDPVETELTGSRLVRIGWALAWRTLVFHGLAAGGLALLTLYLVPTLGVGWVRWLGWLSAPLYGLLSVWVLHAVLTKRFRDFSIRLVKER